MEQGNNRKNQLNPVERDDAGPAAKIETNLDEKTSLPLLAVHDLMKVPLRFNIMFLLYNYDKLGFTRMQKLLHTTPGNLDHHLKKLKEAGWVTDSVFFSPRPLKIFQITPFGADEFDLQIRKFKRVLRNL